MLRKLIPGQSCRLLVVDATTGHTEVVFDSERTLVEAPNWSPDGRFLVVNADGSLWRLAIEGGHLEPVPMGSVPDINNDHVIAPDGSAVYVSANDGHLYEIPWQGGEGRRITRDHPDGRGYKNYLHGISPDGRTLSVIVGSRPTPESTPDEWRTHVALVSVADGATTSVTDDEPADDGAEYSSDGAWLWFNTERFTAEPGHAQLARVRPDGSELTRVLESDTVDWFPHPSPDLTRLVYLSFQAGTTGHPENRDVILRILPLDHGDPAAAEPRDLFRLFGGQGTINVAGWAPDSKRFAFVEYPVA
jgi:TolB protein